jgi:DHA2 family multidrug resistance protein-like MFS transporter
MTTLAGIVVAMILASIGLTPVIALTTAYVTGAVPPEKTGVAAALSETAGELGGALGIALLGSLATLVYRSRMAGAVPAGLPDAGAIGTSLAAAVEAAPGLPAEIAVPLLEAARAAFMTSYHATAFLAAAVMLGLALLSLGTLRGVRAAAH